MVSEIDNANLARLLYNTFTRIANNRLADRYHRLAAQFRFNKNHTAKLSDCYCRDEFGSIDWMAQ
jgi:hypothetical protein